MNGKLLIYAGMGFELVGIMLACLYVGQMIDEKYALNGIAMAGISLLGLAGWLFHLVQLTKITDKNQDGET